MYPPVLGLIHTSTSQLWVRHEKPVDAGEKETSMQVICSGGFLNWGNPEIIQIWILSTRKPMVWGTHILGNFHLSPLPPAAPSHASNCVDFLGNPRMVCQNDWDTQRCSRSFHIKILYYIILYDIILYCVSVMYIYICVCITYIYIYINKLMHIICHPTTYQCSDF